MLTSISIQLGSNRLVAEIYDTPTGRAILAALPCASPANLWGDEIYFRIDVRAPLEANASEEVAVGDLAYWPTMPAFCIFFGPTPVSRGREPRAASAVNVFGRLKNPDLNLLRSVREGDPIRLAVY